MRPMHINYASTPQRRRLRALSIVAIIISLVSTAGCIGLTFADLWSIPAGTSVVAMGLALHVVLIAVATFVIGVGLALIAVLAGHRDPLSILIAIVAVVLSLAPVPVQKLTADWIAARHSWVWGG